MTRDDRFRSSEEHHDRAEQILDWIDWIVSRGIERLDPRERVTMWRDRMNELAEVYAYAHDG